jgi:MarR family transcriptional regulator, organic hydroperoxide resistance regulator
MRTALGKPGLRSDSRHLLDLLTALLSSTFRQILWKRALELDLTYAQAQVLFQVARNPNTLMTDVARTFGITLPAVTQVVDRLVTKKFLERRENPRDRRQVLLAVTGMGQALVQELEQAQLEALDSVLDRLQNGERKEAIRALERLVSAARGEVR